MTKDIFIIPVAPARQQAAVRSSFKPAEGAIRFGVLDNGKSNADHLLGMLVNDARASVPLSSVASLRKSNAAAPAAVTTLDQIAAKADFVISAMAD